MSALAWWLIPLGATFGALMWVGWRSRTRPPADVHHAMAERERFREAMERVSPTPPGTSLPSPDVESESSHRPQLDQTEDNA